MRVVGPDLNIYLTAKGIPDPFLVVSLSLNMKGAVL